VQVQFESTGPCLGRLTLRVPSGEFEDEVQRLLKLAGQRARIKGFRPGKVPAHLLGHLHGKELRQEAKHNFLQRGLEQTLSEHKLELFRRPDADLSGEDPASGREFEQVLSLELRPRFELCDYSDWEVDSAVPPISDADVEAALEQVRRNQGRPEPAGEEGLSDDGMALATVELLHEGQVVFQREGLRMGPQTAIPGVDAQAFQERMRGLRSGQVLEVPLTFPADFEHAAARGQSGLCRIQVKEAYKIVLPTRAELVSSLKLADEAALLARVREKLVEAAQIQEHERVEQVLMARLIDQYSFELPASLVQSQEERIRGTLGSALAAQGLDAARVEQELAGQNQQVRARAERECRSMFVVEKVAAAERLEVQQNDLVAELKRIAERNMTPVEEVASYYREQGLFNQLALEILERKVRRRLREKARLKSPAA
jgi:trigger factor